MPLSLSNRRAIASLVTLTSILVVAACASAGHQRDASACQLGRNDSAFIAGRTLYRDCAVDERARLLTTEIHPDFHPSGGRLCYSADLEFVVDTTGLPETRTAHVTRATDPQFGDAVLATLRTWKYEPARLQGRPVRQLVVERRTIVGVTRVDVLVPVGAAPPTRPPQQRPPTC